MIEIDTLGASSKSLVRIYFMAFNKTALSGLALSILCTFTYGLTAALAVAESEIESALPDIETIRSLAKNNVGQPYVNSLKAQADKLRDYKCMCRLFTRKNNVWKDYGGADYFYKFRGLFKAVIKSKDYRNGSIVVREPSGTIRGCGGGALSFMKITMKEDSRTLQLPTGYSLAQSDFSSLYGTLASSIAGGASLSTSASALNLKLFSEPVTMIVLKEGAASDSPISEVLFISSESKLPMGWHTFQKGVPHAMVLFQNFEPNKGLTTDMFSL